MSKKKRVCPPTLIQMESTNELIQMESMNDADSNGISERSGKMGQGEEAKSGS